MIELLNMDCIEYMAKCSDKQFDLAIVDPPYGINAPNMTMDSNPNRKSETRNGITKPVNGGGVSTAQKLKGRLNAGAGKLKNRALNTMNCDWDVSKPTDEYFDQLFRISKNQIIWGYNYFPLPPTRGIAVWNKNQPWDNFSQCELAWTSFDLPAKLKTLSNRGGENLETKIHPTQKPILLYEWLIKNYAQKDDRIIDTHGGSFSSAIAVYNANKTGMNLSFTGIEINLEYFTAAQARYKMATSQMHLNL